MNKSSESSLSLQALQSLRGILSKPSMLRTEQEKNHTITLLEEINYFRSYISDISQRREYIGEMAQYLKLAYYPKGTLVCNHGDYGVHFSIILRGHAMLYTPKKKCDLEKELLAPGRYGKLSELYHKYIEAQGFHKKQKKWMNFTNTSGRRAAIVGNLENTPKNRSNGGNPKLLQDLENSLKTTLEEVMSPNNSVLKASYSTEDLTVEDKLLALHHNGTNKNFFKEGIATYKKYAEVRGGDTIGELCLTTDLTNEHTIIASEDLYLLSISRDNFRSVILGSTLNLEEKKALFWKTFPQLTIESIIKLCAYVEERVIMNWDIVYREGDEADAIYIVKSGEVQLVTYDKEEKRDLLELPMSKGQKTKKFHNPQKLIVGSIEIAGIFGEDEVINKTNRKYTAISNAALTTLYVLKKRTFYELFEKYFSYISSEFKSILEAKSAWRTRRAEQEKKMAEEARTKDPAPQLHQEQVQIKTPRLLGEIEAEYRRIKWERPEIVMETKTTNVLKYEKRKSRIYKNKVDIIIYDNDDFEQKEQLLAELPGPQNKPHQKHSSMSLDNKKDKKSKGKSVTKIEKVKFNLFEQNQDFQRWKKYYDGLYSVRSQTKILGNSISINSLTHPKTLETRQLKTIQKSFPKLTIKCDSDSQPHLEPSRTINELIPSENNIESLTGLPAQSSKNASAPQSNSVQSIKDAGEQESTRLTPGGFQCFKRVLSTMSRKSSLDTDVPLSATSSKNHGGTFNFLDELLPNKSSISVLSKRPSFSIHNGMPTTFTRRKSKPKTVVVPRAIEISQDHLSQLFVANRGKEEAKVMIFQRELTPRTPVLGSRPGSSTGFKIKNLSTNL